MTPIDAREGKSPNRPSVFLVMSDFPFPARRNGLSIRYAPILRHLATYCDVHLAVVSDTPMSLIDRADVAACNVRLSTFTRVHKSQSLLTKIFARLIAMLPSSTPHPYVFHDRDAIRAFLRNAAGSKEFDVLLVALPVYAELAEVAVRHKRFVVDAIDSCFLAMTRAPSTNPLFLYDRWKVRRWEQRIARRASYWSYVSPHDLARVFGTRADSNRIGVIPNGLYLDDYTSNAAEIEGLTIGFLGNMAFGPNIRAAQELVHIFRGVRQHVPTAKLLIIGRSPAPEVQALGAEDGVHITGTVDSIWPFIHSTTVFAFPMEHGAGQQNKMLEAMVAGIPVVASPTANTGVLAPDPTAVRIATTRAEFVTTIVMLLRDSIERERLGSAGRQFVHERYSWAASLRMVDHHLIARQASVGEGAR